MKRIIQGLALAVVASAAHAASGDAYPSGGAPISVTAKDTHQSLRPQEADTKMTALPSGGAPISVTAKQTYADLHARDATAQSGDAFPHSTAGAGD